MLDHLRRRDHRRRPGLLLGDGQLQALVGLGIEVSDVFHDSGGIFHHIGDANRTIGLAPENADYGSFASFSDPDGNGWLLQEINMRAPGR